MKKIQKLILLSILISSCDNNLISYDLKQQKIVSCGNNSLRTLYIYSALHHFSYYVVKSEGRHGASEIDLSNIHADYVVKDFDNITTLRKIELPANAEVEITNSSYGGPTAIRIFVTTNESGKVVKSDRESCR